MPDPNNQPDQNNPGNPTDTTQPKVSDTLNIPPVPSDTITPQPIVIPDDSTPMPIETPNSPPAPFVPVADDIPPIPRVGDEPPIEKQAEVKTPKIELPPVVVTSGVGTSGSAATGKKMVAAILGVLVLVGGIGAGIILTRQTQELREKAQEVNNICSSESTEDCAGKTWSLDSCNNNQNYLCSLVENRTGTDGKPICECKEVTSGVPPKIQTEIAETKCLDIRAYTVSGSVSDAASWTRLSSTDLSGLKAGDIVYFTVRAQSSDTTTNGGFDKAEFTINDTVSTVTTLKPKTGTDVATEFEFYQSYTIPDTKTQFTIKARVHHQASDTWY